jgi:hypothetical protein
MTNYITTYLVQREYEIQMEKVAIEIEAYVNKYGSLPVLKSILDDVHTEIPKTIEVR